MTKAKKPIPDGYHSVQTCLTVKNAREAIEFYKKALGAHDVNICAGTGDKIMHAELKIGDSIVMLADEFPEFGCKSPATLGGTGSQIFLYVENVDKVFEQAINAGGKVVMPVADQFWGDRSGHFSDPSGHIWHVASRVEDLSKEEIEERKEKWLKQFATAAAK